MEPLFILIYTLFPPSSLTCVADSLLLLRAPVGGSLLEGVLVSKLRIGLLEPGKFFLHEHVVGGGTLLGLALCLLRGLGHRVVLDCEAGRERGPLLWTWGCVWGIRRFCVLLLAFGIHTPHFSAPA